MYYHINVMLQFLIFLFLTFPLTYAVRDLGRIFSKKREYTLIWTYIVAIIVFPESVVRLLALLGSELSEPLIYLGYTLTLFLETPYSWIRWLQCSLLVLTVLSYDENKKTSQLYDFYVELLRLVTYVVVLMSYPYWYLLAILRTFDFPRSELWALHVLAASELYSQLPELILFCNYVWQL